MQSRGRRLDRVLAGMCLLAAWVLAGRAWAFTVDDSYIVARYADNAVRHGQLTFNLGEPAVEGVTSPALLLVAWLFSSVGGSPIVGMKAFGLLGLVCAGLMSFALAEELALPTGSRTAICAYYLMPEVSTFSAAGLETAAFLAACAGIPWLLARAWRDPRKGWHLGLGAVAAAIVRPEGLALGGIALAVWAIPKWKTSRRAIAVAAASFAAPLGALFALRAWLFGGLVPNTYYAKLATSFQLDFSEDLGAFLAARIGEVVVAAIALAAIRRWLDNTGERPSDPVWAVLVSTLTTAAVMCVAYSRHDLVMNYSNRFEHHIFASLWIPIAIVVGWAAKSSSGLWHRRPSQGAWAAAACLLALATTATRWVSNGEDEAHYRRSYLANEVLRRETAAWVSENVPQTAVVGYYPDAGLVPFLVGRHAVDFGKLNDRALAAGTKSSADYLYERNPDVLIVWRKRAGQYWDDNATAMVATPKFATHYEEVSFSGIAKSGRGYVIFQRRP